MRFYMLFCLQNKHARVEQCLFLIPCIIDWRVFYYCLKCWLSVPTPQFFKTSPTISGKNIKNVHYNMVLSYPTDACLFPNDRLFESNYVTRQSQMYYYR